MKKELLFIRKLSIYRHKSENLPLRGINGGTPPCPPRFPRRASRSWGPRRTTSGPRRGGGVAGSAHCHSRTGLDVNFKS